MASHRKKVFNRIDLDSDDAIKDTLVRAAGGQQAAGWWLIHQIESALKDRRVSGPLFDHAASFFGELLKIHDAEGDRATTRDLGGALEKLHIIHSRGQPKRDDQEAQSLAACVALLRMAGFSVDQALGVLEGLNGFPRSAYRTAHDEWGEQFATFPIIAELECMAGVSPEGLLRQLEGVGAIKKAELQKANAKIAILRGNEGGAQVGR